MNLEGATSTARNAAERFGFAYLVYRLPMWPAGVYGVIAKKNGLPSEAEIVEELQPAAATPPPPPQGSLF